MTSVAVGLAAALGVALLLWDVRAQPSTTGGPPALPTELPRPTTGPGSVGPGDVTALSSVLAVAGLFAAIAVFGGITPGVLGAATGAATPPLALRRRRRTRREIAQQAWPRILDEIRVMVANAGTSVPQALFEAGGRSHPELAPAFAAAHREWLVTTEFGRALAVLKAELAHPTADVACETLLVAHEIGAVDVDARLAALVEDRQADVQARKDARSRLAGARFARAFVLIVPLGMAAMGLGIGAGRAAYATATGQVLVAFGLVVMMACWIWAGRIMALPPDDRVFA